MEPDNIDLALLLPRDTYFQVIRTLRTSLPPPVSDSPDDLLRRDHAAIAQVACLLPANADEATLAAQYVAANAQALDCLRLIRAAALDPGFALKGSAQAASMMRQARGARALLLRVQAERQKREANNTTLDPANWIEHCAINLMAGALPATSLAATSGTADPPPPSLTADATA